MNSILEFTIALPKIGVGKYKNQHPLMNNAPVWMRYYQKKIKDTFKQNLIEWFVPPNISEFQQGTVVFTIYKKNRRSMDADSIAFIGKWCTDLLVSQGWFKDDNQIIFIYKPMIIEKDRVETEMKVEVYKEHIV